MNRISILTSAPLVALLAMPGLLLAQFNLGTITGRITDPSGAVIPGCQVRVENVNTRVARKTETDATGLYTVTALTSGRYRVTASKEGFQEASATVDLGVTQTLSADLQLVVGATAQVVNVSVSAAQAQLQKEDHVITQLVSQRQIEALPMNGRNLLSLATLGPGAQHGSDIINGSNDGGSAQYFQVTSNLVILGGQSVGHTTFLQDGVANVALFTQSINILPDPDSVQQFSVDTNGMDAKFDQPSVVNVVTKGGSNQFHGSAYDYFRNRVLDAQTFFGNVSNLPKGVYQYNQFGGTIGGPIRRDKAFFFFNYEGLRNPSSSPFSARIPTAKERQGDFSEDLAGVPVAGGKIQSTTIYDPLTYNPVTQSIQAFPGNVIPSQRLSAFANQYTQFWPNPTGPILVDGTNFRTNLRSTNTTNLYLGRVDYNLSSRDTLYGLFQDYNSPSISQSFVPNLFGNTYNRHGDNAALEETHVFSPTLLNVARVGFNRSVFFNSQLGVGAQDWVGLFGVHNLRPAAEQNSPPGVSITGCCSLGNIFAPQGAVQNRYQFADEVDYAAGKHKVSAGAEVDRVQFDGNWVLVNSGYFTFNGQYTSNHQPGTAFVPGLGTADFMLGLPNFAWGSVGNTTAAFRQTDFAVYAQDTWRIRPNLTLNLGLRYQHYSPPRDKYGHASTFDLAQGQAIPGPWDTNNRDFGPRVGVAYTLTPNTVIRSGFGLYYTSTPYNVMQFALANPPNFLSQQISPSLLETTPVDQYFPSFSGTSVFAPFALAKHNPDAYLEQWNFNIQRTLPWETIVSAAYVGNAGHHLSIRLNPNQASPDVNPLNPTPIQSRRPYPNIGDVLAQYPIGNSNYSSLQVKVEKRVTHDLSFLASYTYSKSLDLLSTDGGDLVNGLDPERNYGPSDFDRPQQFTFSYVYQLPIGAGRRFVDRNDWIGKQLLGGWQVNGITTFDSGLPFGVLASDFSNTGGNHEFYADRVCNGNLPISQRTRLQWFNTSCFTQPPLGTLGNSGRNVLRMGGIKTWDFSLFKVFALGESRSLEFRSEYFNLFNQHSFSVGNVSVTDPSYGQATGTTTGPRVIQFALKFLF